MFMVREGDSHPNHLYYVQYIKYKECVGGSLFASCAHTDQLT